jgi:DnaJ-class molecular chaperone
MAKCKSKKEFMNGYNYYDPENEGYGNSFEWKRHFRQRMSKEEAEAIIENDDPWELLGIKHGANAEDIKRAFWHQAMYWHPDVSHEPKEKATKMMQKINAAYSLLSHIGKN